MTDAENVTEPTADAEPTKLPKIRLIAKPAVTPDALVDSMWELIGGRDTFEKLVREFYVGVATDEVLLPMYPEQPDLEGAIQRLTGFLEQHWGGPNTYSQERGHPRLRMRHMPFKVNPDARDRWLHRMRAALDTRELPPLYDAEIWTSLDRAAHAIVNTFEEQRRIHHSRWISIGC
jgi:hemoglobin